jgi:predicted transcriptional regulator
MSDPMRDATRFILKVARNPQKFPHHFVAIRRQSVARILSGERTRLLDLLEAHGPYPQIQELAAALKRKPSSVARDLRDLEATGLVERTPDGRNVRIQATCKPVLVV